MKFVKVSIFLTICIYVAACSSTRNTHTQKKKSIIFQQPKQQLPLFTEAVERLGTRLIVELDRLEIRHDSIFYSSRPSYFIFNSKAENQRKERRLAKRFIEELNDYLVQKGIFIKRKEMATCARAT
ncbi:secreted protein, partial [Candidatus Magnetomorum sp. HK-1]